MKDKIIIQWLGHSCFKLTFGEWQCVVDPYEDGSVPGLGNIRESAMAVYASHEHHDHNARETVLINKMFAPKPGIKEIKCWHDDEHGAKRGENIIRLFDYNGMKLAHFGDLGHLLDAETAKEIGNIDVALLPVGGFYTIDAKTAKAVAASVNAKVVIPMHYRGRGFGFPVIGTAEEYTALCDDVVYYDTSIFEYTADTPKQTAILTPENLGK